MIACMIALNALYHAASEQLMNLHFVLFCGYIHESEAEKESHGVSSSYTFSTGYLAGK